MLCSLIHREACFHLTDRVGKLCCQFSLHTICTIWIFYYFCHRFSPFHSAPSCRTARAVLNHYCFKDTTDAAKFQQLSYCQFPLSSKYCNHSGRGNAFRHSEQLQRILRNRYDCPYPKAAFLCYNKAVPYTAAGTPKISIHNRRLNHL